MPYFPNVISYTKETIGLYWINPDYIFLAVVLSASSWHIIEWLFGRFTHKVWSLYHNKLFDHDFERQML